MSRPHHTWITPGAYDRLSRELATLTAGGDDSAGTDFARLPDEEARQARIARIQEVLRDAVVGEAPPDDGIAEPGMVVTVRYEGDDEPETFLLGVRDGSAEEELTVYSPSSPLGQVLVGAARGEQRAFTTPSGKTIRVTLVDAEPYDKYRNHVASED